MSAKATLGALLLCVSAFAQDTAPVAETGPQYVEITGTNVNLRAGPDTSEPAITKARIGDIFRSGGAVGDWHRIFLFSGEHRFVHGSLVRRTNYTATAPADPAERQRLYRALAAASVRAQQEATSRYPMRNSGGGLIQANMEANHREAGFLTDLYQLEVCHRFSVQPPIHSDIINEASREGWR